MGISGLLPLLKSIQNPCNLKKFAGQTIGVDAYGWLHRGTVACAVDLAFGRPTRKYIDFSLNRVRMLIHFGVVPYLVFDGDYLPGKAATEQDRAKRREESKRKGLELHRMNKLPQAQLELQKAVDVTPTMARELMEELKKLGVEYVVAPYEADAQLVYMEKHGIINGMLSEDSDMLVFGAKKLLTKLDQYGDCVEINRDNFTACREISLVGWSDTEFRRMAILSGCDYLASISGMGLKNAYRLVRKYKDIEKIVRMLRFDGKFSVPEGYLEAFQKAEMTFLHQRVFCPLKKEVVTLTEVRGTVNPEALSMIGGDIDKATAIAISTGYLEPNTRVPIVLPQTNYARTRAAWPGSRRPVEGGAPLSEVKGNKSIDTFFKSKRTPLAELSPNIFTPSPTQGRLLEQAADAQWDSSPAPAGPPANLRTSTSVPIFRSEHFREEALPPHRTSLGLPAMTSVKRRRLFDDCVSTTKVDQGAENTEIVRSAYFTSSAPMLSVPGPVAKRKSKKTKADFHIWSDESLEDAMSALSEKELMNSTQRVDCEPVQSPRLDDATENTLATKDLSPDLSDRSNLPELAIVAPVREPIRVLAASCKYSGTNIGMMKTTIAERSISTMSRHGDLQGGHSAPTGLQDENEKSAAVPDRGQSRPLLQRRSTTALQRLGLGAGALQLVARSQSSSNLRAVAVEIETLERPRDMSTSAALLTTTLGGSEDTLEPGSEAEEEVEEVEEVEEAKKGEGTEETVQGRTETMTAGTRRKDDDLKISSVELREPESVQERMTAGVQCALGGHGRRISLGRFAFTA